MGVGYEAIIAPPMQQVTHIDHKGSGHGVGCQPITISISDLQPANLILIQNSDAAIVGVGRDAELAVAHIIWLRWIIDHCRAGQGFVEMFDEMIVGQIQPSGKGAQQGNAQAIIKRN